MRGTWQARRICGEIFPEGAAGGRDWAFTGAQLGEGKKHWTTDVIIEEQHFAESKNSSNAAAPKEGGQAAADGFYPIDESVEDDDLPF